jgi:hypothetical protein
MIHIVAMLTATHRQREALLTEFQKNLTTVRLQHGCVRYDAVIDIEGGKETLARIGPDAFMVIEQLGEPRGSGGARRICSYGSIRWPRKRALALPCRLGASQHLACCGDRWPIEPIY